VPGGRVLVGGRVVAERDVGAAAALVPQRLPDGGQSRVGGGVAVVPAGDGDGAGHGQARPGRGAERAEGELVAHRGDRVRGVAAAEQLVGEGFAERGGIGRAHGDRRSSGEPPACRQASR
jgi:hypothetical protein